MRRFAALAGVALLVAGFAWAMRSEPTPQAVTATPTPPVAIRAEQPRVVVRHRGERQVDLRAREAEVSPDQQRATLKDVGRAVVFREGKEFLYVSAQRLVLNRKTQNFVATGGVEVRSPSGDWLRAPEVVYHNDQGVLVFPSGVEFQIGSNHARARTLRYYVQRDVVEMEGAVDIQLDVRSLPTRPPGVGR